MNSRSVRRAMIRIASHYGAPKTGASQKSRGCPHCVSTKARETPRLADIPKRRHTSRCCRPRRPVPSNGRPLVLAVDTNVLVCAADADSQFHGPCRDWLERQRARPDAWYTTWGILYEFLRVTTHPRVMRTGVERTGFVGVRHRAARLARPRRSRPDTTTLRRRRGSYFGVAISRR
jgi:hypothetical protein